MGVQKVSILFKKINLFNNYQLYSTVLKSCYIRKILDILRLRERTELELIIWRPNVQVLLPTLSILFKLLIING
ncbi:hypothetical protein SCALIN_C34_0029 [Candidatus Scalindua japonica]|uniref:Uncharacterized protein n=1 Tax=Candidatus Scalindua japonica TaxID=1284222 RepID=A0A286U2W0_9BACT|nr:hypothetical protein SCALIN_C34_0029 [Candidatus Scalindua japonica]